MKLSKLLIIATCTYLTGCTPAEVIVGEEIAEEVVEEVIEWDHRGARAPESYPPANNWTAPSKGQYMSSHGMLKHDDTTPIDIKNQRQYPRRHEKNPGWGQQNRGA